MSNLHLRKTSISGVNILDRSPHGDDRGFLERLYCQEELDSILEGRRIEQINRTLTVQTGTVRGLHFQYPPQAETKIVSCVRGSVFDVAIDLRRRSPTFLKWHGERLSGDGHRSLVIPEGCAHGFQTLVSDCEMLYFHTSSYSPALEGGFHPEDPTLDINWPLPIAELSQRDSQHPSLDTNFQGIPL